MANPNHTVRGLIASAYVLIPLTLALMAATVWQGLSAFHLALFAVQGACLLAQVVIIVKLRRI